MRHRSLPRLTIPVACPADWSAMEPISGDNRARLCRSCDKPVYDSKSMTRDELYALIVQTEGALPCLQLHQRPDGTVVTKGCLAAVYRASRTLWLKAAALAIAFWTGVTGLRRTCDVATAPQAVSLELKGEPYMTRGMVGLVMVPPEPDPPWLRSPTTPPAKTADVESAEPLRRLQVEEALFPPGWR